MTFTEGLQLVITFLAAIAAVSSAISAIKSWSAAEKANEISKRALEIALHDHQVKVMPDLTAQLFLNSDSIDVFHLLLTNIQHSRCTLHGYKFNSRVTDTDSNFVVAVPLTEPDELTLGALRLIKVIPASQAVTDKIIGTARTRQVLQHFKGNALIEVVKQFLEVETFVVEFTDELGTLYIINMHLDKEQSMFVGRPQERKTEKK